MTPQHRRSVGRVAAASPLLAAVVAWAAFAGLSACRDTYLYPVVALDAAVAPSPADGSAERPMDALADTATDSSPDMVTVICPRDLPLFGFGAEPPGATGGGNIQPVVVTTAAELTAQASTNDEPRVIEIGRVIDLTGPIEVKSNKTIRGTARDAGLRGGGLMLDHSKNVIVQRLKISEPLPPKGDAISVEYAQNIWIDHCDLSGDLGLVKGTYDNLLDITHGSINVTVSWNVFHDHYNATIVGHSDMNAMEDVGALTVTYHHNWFRNIPNNTPRVRFGRVHVYNNLFQDIMGAVASTMSAQVFVQGNVFHRVTMPILTFYESRDPGFASEADNVFADYPPNITMPSSWIPPYQYFPNPSAEVPALVQACAGQRF